jgi:hypothetical protein
LRRVLLPVLVLTGCAAGENTDCTVAFAPDAHTVLSARWTSPHAGRSWAEYDLDGEVRATPVVEDTGVDHQAALLGLAPVTDVDWTLITEDGDHRWECSGTSKTENTPPQTISLDVVTWDPDRMDPAKYLLGTAFAWGPPSSVYVIDRETGSTRW